MATTTTNTNTNSSGNKSCLLFPPFPLCSAQGTCDTTRGICICKEGWSSIGDFAIQDGVDCNISIVAVRVTYSILTVLSSFAVVYIARCIVKQYYSSTTNHESIVGFLTEPVRSFQVWAWLLSFGGLVNGVYRASQPLSAVGNDVFLTCMVTLLTSFWINGASDLSIVILRFLNMYAQSMPSAASARMKEVTQVVMKITPFFRIFGFLFALTPLLTLAFPNHMYEIGATYFISFAIWDAAIAVFSIIRSINIMVNLLKNHLDNMESAKQAKNQKMEDLLKKLTLARNVFLNIAPGPIIGFLLFGISPSFSRNMTYLVVYNTLTGVVACIAAVSILSNNSNKPKENLSSPSSKNQITSERFAGKKSRSKVSTAEDDTSNEKGIISPAL